MAEVQVDPEALRRDIVRYSRLTWERGWVANHDGNLSARLGDGRFLATPTAVSKGDVEPGWLIVVDADRTVLEGTRRAFSEFAMHTAAYAARPDIGVVIHAHPPHATAYAVSGKPLPHPFLHEAVVTLGPELPVVPYGLPGEPALERGIAAALQRADVALLDRHGVLAVGGSFEQAWLRLELVEHLATIALKAEALGGVRPLPAERVAKLAAKGRPASQPSFAPAPAPPRSAPAPSPAAAGRRPDLGQLVGDALRRYQG